METLISFSLDFRDHSARFPFIFNGKPVTSIGTRPAPSCCISGRDAGDMIFRLPNSNRSAFFGAHHIPAEKVYGLFQVHSRDVFSLGYPENNSREIASLLPSPGLFAREGDGMVSFSEGLFLAVTVADCLPVFLLDTENGYLALVHSGWKGTGIVVTAMEIMQKAGCRPEAIAAVLGPCIQGCCYMVNQERAEYFEAAFGAASSNYSSGGFPLGDVIRHDETGWFINMQAANARLLAGLGVKHIAYCTDCTFTDTRLGSFRREGPESYTRMLAVTGVFV